MTIAELKPIINSLPDDVVVAHEKYMQTEYESIELKSFDYDFNEKRITFKG